jgi:hypothetical protein
MGTLGCPLNTYKPLGSTIYLIRKHVYLKEVVLWLKRGQKVPFLREKRPFKKVTPKVGANIGAITGILLIDQSYTPLPVSFIFSKKKQKYQNTRWQTNWMMAMVLSKLPSTMKLNILPADQQYGEGK